MIALYDLPAQIENVPVSNPVYSFLQRLDNNGLIKHYSFSSLPWRKEIVLKALHEAKNNSKRINLDEQEVLLIDKFIKEFELKSINSAVLIYSETDSSQIFFSNLFDSKEKLFFRYSDTSKNIAIKPIYALDYLNNLDKKQYSVIGTLGLRLEGTISDRLGYYLQATNGRVVSGERELFLSDPRYGKSIKFTKLNDDIDLSESHLAYRNDWFYASIGRQYLSEGAGLNNRLFISSNSPSFDAVTLSAQFKTFEYSFIHASLLGIAESYWDTGFSSEIPPKYMAYHKFLLKPSWGEIGFVEQVVYGNRSTDLAYLNPIGFLKSIEHSLHDRDNSLMGLWTVIKPVDGLQFKMSYLLDDIIFEKVGTGYWSNKMAWDFALIASLPYGFDFGAEYSRIEPFTYTHFNYQLSMTNDKQMIGSILKPNSDLVALKLNWWWGQRYPISLNIGFIRHGNNIFDADSLIFNAGGDVLQTRRPFDPMTIKFLDGKLEKTSYIEFTGFYEFFRGLMLQALVGYKNINGKPEKYFRFTISSEGY